MKTLIINSMLIIILPLICNANALSPQMIAELNLGYKRGAYSITGENCTFKVEESISGISGEYHVWFNRPGRYTGVSTKNIERWMIDSQNKVLIYTHSTKNITAYFYFDENLIIHSYALEGESRGICNFN